jgi:hypothetical protein
MQLKIHQLKILIQESIKEHFYHGSSKQLPKKLIANSRPTEFSKRISIDGISVEDFVESQRPEKCVSRLRCIFLVNDINDLNIAGASEDFVYEVKPVGRFSKVHFGWFSELLGMVYEEEGLIDNPKAIKLANGYWSGKPFIRKGNSSPAAWEFLAEEVEIIKLVNQRKKKQK